MRISDLPLLGTKLKITRQHGGGNTFIPTKGKDARYVPFSTGLRSEIENVLSNRVIESSSLTIFQTLVGTPVDHDNFTERIFRKDVVSCGVRAIRFHDLRHTSLTLMVKKGIPIPVIQKIAGHKDIKTTMKYVHILGKDIEDVGLALGLSV